MKPVDDNDATTLMPKSQLSQLRGSEVEKDLGIASQHRARLKARLAGNILPGLAARPRSDEERSILVSELVPMSLDMAELILRGCGL